MKRIGKRSEELFSRRMSMTRCLGQQNHDIDDRLRPFRFAGPNPRFTQRGEDVVQMLQRACAQVGYPATIRNAH